MGLSRRNPIVSWGRSVDWKGLVFLVYWNTFYFKEIPSENFSSEEMWLMVFSSFHQHCALRHVRKSLECRIPCGPRRRPSSPPPVRLHRRFTEVGGILLCRCLLRRFCLEENSAEYPSLQGLPFIIRNWFTLFGLYCDFSPSWGCNGKRLSPSIHDSPRTWGPAN